MTGLATQIKLKMQAVTITIPRVKKMRQPMAMQPMAMRIKLLLPLPQDSKVTLSLLCQLRIVNITQSLPSTSQSLTPSAIFGNTTGSTLAILETVTVHLLRSL